MCVYILKLEEVGWIVVSREFGSRVYIFFMDFKGYKFRSVKDVESKLEVDGILL